MISIEIQNGPSSKSTPTFVPEMYEISANAFMASYSAFPKIQSTKQSVPPCACVNCPCQFHYIGGEMLPLQLTSSAGHAHYPLYSQYGHPWPLVWAEASQVNLQNLAIGKVKKQSRKQSMVPRKNQPRCDICDTVFSRKSSLIVHMRRHSGEKPFKCTYCNKAFTQSANLGTHLRIHTGEKPYACSVCGKCFSQSYSVTTHMRTHTGERPFQCAECGKTFAERSTLSKHYRVHIRKHKPKQAF